MRRKALITLLALAIGTWLITEPSRAQNSDSDRFPVYLQDRGTGIATSMFGTYVRQGELLIYPFFEYYRDRNLEYKPSELGFGLDQDFRGRFRASEGLIFLSYGFTGRLAAELEASVIQASLYKSSGDTSAMPAKLSESGLGDVESQIRWRWFKENSHRPELISFFETVFPLQKDKVLIGTSDWEFTLGTAITKGFGWGTMTLRAGISHSRADNKTDLGEWTVDYVKRISSFWRIYAGVEGEQDEVSLITEAQWHLSPHAFVKLNNGFGLTSKATDWAPEIGIVFPLQRR